MEWMASELTLFQGRFNGSDRQFVFVETGMFQMVRTLGSIASTRQIFGVLMMSFILTTTVTSTGCVSLLANLIHIIQGRKVPAPCDKLEGKRVAVVVNSEAGTNDQSVVMLGRYIRERMLANVEKIELVPQDQVEKWTLEQYWEDLDYEAIGKGVKADYVVAVDLTELQLRDGDTLYRGSCSVYTTVYEVGKPNKPVYKTSMLNYSFPSVGGQPITGTDETAFRRLFLGIVGHRVARNFHPYDPSEDIAADAEAAIF